MQTLRELLAVDEKTSVTSATEKLADQDLTLQEFCQAVLSSREYRLSLLMRVEAGELPPAIERWLWDTAHPRKDWPVSPLAEGGEPVICEIRRVLVRPAPDDDEDERPTRTH